MNREVLDKVIQCLTLIYDPKVSNAQRQQAQQFCEELKEDPAAPLYGHFLAHCANQQSDTVRYFGLGLLENAIRFRWHTGNYSAEEKKQIRDAVVDLVRHGLLPGAQEKKFIKEKMARTLAELAEREWPQRWPELDPLLQDLFQTSEDSQELAVMVLRYIAEDVFTFTTPVTVSRKDDLRSALIAITARAPATEEAAKKAPVPTELYGICNVMPGNDGWLSKITACLFVQMEAINSGSKTPRTESMAILCLNAITAYLEWLPLETIIEEGIVFKIFSLLVHPSQPIRMAASEGALLITARKFSEWKDAENVLLKPLLVQGGVDVVKQAYALASFQKDMDVEEYLGDHYLFTKRLAQIWINIGVDQICIKKNTVVPPGLQHFLAFAMELTQHPSLSITLMMLHFWHTAFRHDAIAKSEMVAGCYTALYDILIFKFKKSLYLPSDEDGAPMGCRFSYADFPESLADYQAAFGSFRSQCFSIIKLVMERHPTYVLSRCIEVIQLTIQMPTPSPNDLHRSKITGVLTVASPYFIEWEAAASLVHATTQDLSYILASPKHQAALPQLQGMMEKLLDMLLAFESHEPLIIGRQLDAITQFAELVKAEPDRYAFALLQKVFTFVTFTLPKEPKTVDAYWDLSEDTYALRRKACTSLLRLASGIPDVLMVIYGQISSEIDRLVQERSVSYGEKTYLVEFRTTIIHHCTSLSLAEKQPLYNALFEPLASEIVSEGTLTKVSTFNAFLDICGLTPLAELVRSRPANITAVLKSPEVVKVFAERRLARSRLLYLVNAYKSCLTRSVRSGGGSSSMSTEQRVEIMAASPWAVHLQRVLPMICLLLQHIHSLWNSQLWNGPAAILPKELESVLELTPGERAIILGATPTEVAEEEQTRLQQQTASTQELVHQIRAWLRVVKETTYHLLGSACYLVPGEYFFTVASPVSGKASFGECIRDLVFSTAVHLDPYHWRLLVQIVVRPFVLNCPRHRMKDTLVPTLVPIVQFLGKKLDDEWKDLIKRGLVGTLEETGMASPSGDKSMFGGNGSGAAEDNATASNEVIQQRVLRDLTRTWSDLWAVVFQLKNPDTHGGVSTPGGPKSFSAKHAAGNIKQAQKSGNVAAGRIIMDIMQYPDLAQLVVETMEIAEPLFYTFLNSMSWKDTRTCIQSARSLMNLVPFLVADPKFYAFLGKDMLMGAFQALHDGYHQEGHDAVVSLVVEIYTLLRPISPIPAHTFQSVVPELADPAAFQNFEVRYAKEQTASGHRKLIREALKGIIGNKPGQWFRKLDANSSAALVLSVPEKLYIRKQPAASTSTTADQEREGQEDLGLLDLFAK